AFAAGTAAAQSIEIRLADGARWRGEVGDDVQLTIRQRGVEAEMSGRITAAADLYITLEVEVAGENRSRTIFKADIVSIKSAGSSRESGDSPRPRTSTRTGEAASTKETESKPEAAASKENAPGVFVLPLTGMVGETF